MQQTLPRRILFHPVSKRQLSKRLYTRRRRHRGTLRLCGTSRASDLASNLASNLDLFLTPTLPRRRSSSESAHTSSCAEEATISSRKRREETVSISFWRVLVLSLKCTKARNARVCCAGGARSIETAWNDIIFCIARQSRRGRKGPSRCADGIAAEGWKHFFFTVGQPSPSPSKATRYRWIWEVVPAHDRVLSLWKADSREKAAGCSASGLLLPLYAFPYLTAPVSRASSGERKPVAVPV